MSDWMEVGNENSENWDTKAPLIGKYAHTKEDVGPNHSKMHFVRTDKGLVGAWGSTVLDNKMESVIKGQDVKITYLGVVENPKTKREYKDYSVQVKEFLGEDVTDSEEIPFEG